MKYFWIVGFISLSFSAFGAEIDNWIYLSTKQDIQQADPLSTHVSIRYLPIEDYPMLDKFRNVKEIDLACQEGTFATDDKLKALASLNFKNLNDIVLTNCRLITDEGISALVKIQSLKELGLEGTTVSDASLETIATKMRLSGVDISNCSKITLKGLQKLATCESLQEISFSANELTQNEILNLFDSFRKVNWCQIVDPQNKLDKKILKAKAAEKNFSLVIKATGALQDTFEIKN